MELKKTYYHDKIVDGEMSKRVCYTGAGYQITISLLFGEVLVMFEALGAVYKPQIILMPGKTKYLRMDGICYMEDVDEFLENVQVAKELATYVEEHLEELLHPPDEEN